MDIQATIKKMTLKEKVRLTSGKTFWLTHDFEHLNIPSLKMSDGPHGVRCQSESEDHLGVNRSIPATCFPTASLLASSWDEGLIEEVGQHIGKEANAFGVHVVLGPGVNIKRNPLCGRNFEYFSEDPLLAGKMGAAWIRGVESTGVGSSVKHFAANNQEDQRMLSDSLVDTRALFEMYLRPFEISIQQGQPATIMSSYNKVNGTYLSDHTYLLNDVLRTSFGFKGVVVTDWGALHHKVKSLEATNDLEMPTSKQMFDKDVIKAVVSGQLDESTLDASVARILSMVSKYAFKPKGTFDAQLHHQFARKVACEGAILCKNESDILPLSKDTPMALVGRLAKEFRYQGSGSSHIQPTRLVSIHDAFVQADVDFVYEDGYDLEDNEIDASFISKLKRYEVIVYVMGLPDAYESEGYDRTHMNLPENQMSLLKYLNNQGKKVVVVLLGGSPVTMDWEEYAHAILHMQLSGQAGGEATVDLLFGYSNPSGKFAETYPLAYKDVVSSPYYGVHPRIAQYRESIYVGYRYFDKVNLPVRYPFGFGLSYTKFQLSDIRIKQNHDGFHVCGKIQNVGSRFGKEVVQCYVTNTERTAMVAKQLAGFAKIGLEIDEIKEFEFSLDPRVFEFYQEEQHRFEAMGGEFVFEVGTSSRKIIYQTKMSLGPIHPSLLQVLPLWYSNPVGLVSKTDFESLYGQSVQDEQIFNRSKFTLMSTFEDMADSKSVSLFTFFMKRELCKRSGGDVDSLEYQFLVKMTMNTPLQRLCQQSAGMIPLSVFKTLVFLANHKL